MRNFKTAGKIQILYHFCVILLIIRRENDFIQIAAKTAQNMKFLFFFQNLT